jgi:two-component system sensor histidine kinase PilS (NtrC family)
MHPLDELIVAHIPVMALVIGTDGRIAAATRPASKLAGGLPVVGLPWEQALPAALVAAADLPAQLERARRLGRDITLHRVDAEIDGFQRSFRVTVVPLADPLAQALLHVEDLTEAVDTEARFRRTETLLRLGEMSEAVAHELRNPLAGVSGALQIITRGLPATDPRRVVMEKVDQQLMRMNSLVADLLAFARPGMPHPVTVDLAMVAAEAIAAAGADHPGPTWLVAGAGSAWADPAHVREILVQIVGNAAQAAPKGQVRVAVSDARVVVTDDGPGVPAAIRSRIFEPFFTTRTRGTGLGLPIALQMAQAMGGGLELAPPDGGGATFVLTLPTNAAR